MYHYMLRQTCSNAVPNLHNMWSWPSLTILSQGLLESFQVEDLWFVLQKPRPATNSEMLAFHDAYYLQYLAMVTPENIGNKEHGWSTKASEYRFDEDCPPFHGLFDFCRLYTGASLQGAKRLNHGLCDIAINWAGGLHHAKKASASGPPSSFQDMCSNRFALGIRHIKKVQKVRKRELFLKSNRA